MNTRRAADDSVFRQEKYMRSPELQRGLLANCVASRVRALATAEDRKLIWFLQRLSQTDGGLKTAAREMLKLWPERIGTAKMHEFGRRDGQHYNAEQVKALRWWDDWNDETDYPLRGEITAGDRERAEQAATRVTRHEDAWGASTETKTIDEKRRQAERRQLAQAHPKSYPAAGFVARCQEEARSEFAAFLFEQLCLNPEVQINEQTLSYLPDLRGMLRDYHTHCAAAAATAPLTEIGAQVQGTLEYALAERCLVVIDGLARTGKTFAVQAWCEAHAGEARYVQVPSSNDEISFYRALCEALGLGASRAYRLNELRAKVENVLHGGDLLIVMDEGHYLWPQRNVRQASIPQRINWVLTQLVNMGVPVAIVTTPQFTKNQEAIVRNGGWSSEQLIGRVSHYQRLPDSLCEQDLEAVARHWLPGGDAKAIRVLVTYAQSSEKYLQGITSLARRARFLAGKAGRAQPTFQEQRH